MARQRLSDWWRAYVKRRLQRPRRELVIWAIAFMALLLAAAVAAVVGR